MPKRKQQWEEQMADALAHGEMKLADPQEAAVDRLPPKWEIRIRAKRDPIVEETRRYREMAQEADGRYDAYMSGQQPDKPAAGKSDNP